MARKKKSKTASLSWCWYCDRSFEDDKVLLQHQKAKHFRCPHCPRRLNTAGGLAVHIDQVHKTGTDKIENALPGRDSFDIEIYGMEGIPAADLAAWKKRVAEESGGADPGAAQRASKKPKVVNVVLTVQELAIALANHKALMAGLPLPGAAAAPAGVPPPGFGIPPPPPSFIPPPPNGMPFPPPPFALPPGIPPPPGGIFPPLPFALPPGLAASSPFPAGAIPAGLPFPPPPGGFPPGFPPPPGMSSIPTGPAALRGMEGTQREKLKSSQVELKPGSLLVYGDNEVSPEEKRAQLAQYKVVETLPPAPVAAAVPEAAPAKVEEVTPIETNAPVVEEGTTVGKKRARATDLME